ncbi:hypothetical protein [Infirmifilum uzonense]|uniref:hypothetical protein n=1 Tax=Infirmifilum uzonense TaxID=1550241 RepID=UPI003C70E5EE
MAEGPTPLFINVYMYAINKASARVLGKSATVLSRCVTDDLWQYLVSRGLLPEKPSPEDLRRLFVETLGVARDVVYEEKSGEVIFTFKGVTLREFMEAIMKERLQPVVCPFTSILAKACEEMSTGKLVIWKIEPLDAENLRVICRRTLN